MLFGGAAAWPLAARTQQDALPVIGILGTNSQQSDAFRLTAFNQGLNESGYVNEWERSIRIPMGGRHLRSTTRAGD